MIDATLVPTPVPSPWAADGPRDTGWASSASTLSPVLLFVPDLLFTGSRAHADQWWLQAPLHGAALAWACCDSGVSVYWMAVLIRGRVERSTGRKSGVGSGRSFGVGCEAALRPPWTPNRRDGYQSHVLGSRLVFPISFGVEESVEIGWGWFAVIGNPSHPNHENPDPVMIVKVTASCHCPASARVYAFCCKGAPP